MITSEHPGRSDDAPPRLRLAIAPRGPVDVRRRRRSGRNRRRSVAALISLIVGIGIVVVLLPGQPRRATACVDPGPTVSDLAEFDHVVGRRIGCVELFDNAAQTWNEWARPWFITNPISNENWTAFARAGHEIVITVDLFPSELDDTDWRQAGAAGRYVGYAQELARNLVAAGMGHAVIRLAHEANGTWYADNVGDTTAQEELWRTFWRRTAIAMRGVPGAHFSFDWCVAAAIRPIPLANYYPGNDVVDSIGVDVYDSDVPSGVKDRWTYLYDLPESVGAVARFARLHHKPLAIPEWGLQPTTVTEGGGGDPGFTRGIADLVRRGDVAFQSYFFNEGGRSALLADPASLRIYRRELLP